MILTTDDNYDPESYTSCWHCPQPTCENPPSTCTRKRFGTVIVMDLRPDENTKYEHIEHFPVV